MIEHSKRESIVIKSPTGTNQFKYCSTSLSAMAVNIPLNGEGGRKEKTKDRIELMIPATALQISAIPTPPNLL